MEQQLELVNSMVAQQRELQTQLHAHAESLASERIKLVRMCEASPDGHDYVAEDNGDYHKPGLYYTCAVCKHFTVIRPAKYRFHT